MEKTGLLHRRHHETDFHTMEMSNVMEVRSYDLFPTFIHVTIWKWPQFSSRHMCAIILQVSAYQMVMLLIDNKAQKEWAYSKINKIRQQEN
jgi:hypothetical protein